MLACAAQIRLKCSPWEFCVNSTNSAFHCEYQCLNTNLLFCPPSSEDSSRASVTSRVPRMYHQDNLLYDSIGRRLSTNPFRTNSGSGLVLANPLSNSAFDEWVQKNRTLMSDSSDEEEHQVFHRPSFPSQTRTGSDTNVNYSRKMTSNNPFAAAMNGEYKHHRDPPPPPVPTQTTRVRSPSKDQKPPTRDTRPSREFAPPSYEEAAGPTPKTYPKEKEPLRLGKSSSRHRSHSDSEKHRERRSRHKTKESKKKAVAPHKPKNLDVIDKLDVSAFFGGRFHHDGPFDACAPHRNKNVKAPPVMAYAADGPNNSMKANAGPSNNMDLTFGHFEDQNMIVGRSASLNSGPKTHSRTLGNLGDVPRLNPSVVAFDAHEKASPIHGLSTAGLGSTTFLNGAPAPKTEELVPPTANKGGLGRRKSLAQRLRKNSSSDVTARRGSNDSANEYRRASLEDEEVSSSLLLRVKSLKVGRK